MIEANVFGWEINTTWLPSNPIVDVLALLARNRSRQGNLSCGHKGCQRSLRKEKVQRRTT
jgi:hypothetical protein